MNSLNIEDRTTVERAIAGALKSTINVHGKIDYSLIGSASKRIYGQLKNLSKTQKKVKNESNFT